jgi:hypothetical protein
MTIRLNGSTSGYVEIDAPAVGGNTSVVFPSSSGTIQLVPGSWTAYTPTLGSLTLGNGTMSFFYSQVGKTVNIRGLITLGSTSSVGANPTFTLPVPNNTSATSQNATPMGHVCYVDTGVAQYFGYATWNSSNTLLFSITNIAGTYPVIATVQSNVPFTWGSGDQFAVVASYEAA